MDKYHHKDLSKIVESSESLKSLSAKAKLLHELNTLLAGQINPEQQKYCKIANFRDNQIIVACTSAAWATKIRMQAPDLLKMFRLSLPSAANIKVVIQMPERQTTQAAETTTPPSVSKQAAKQLGEFAENIQNQRLRNVLTSLSKRGDNK